MKKILMNVVVVTIIGLTAFSCSNASRHCYEVTKIGEGKTLIYHEWASQDEMESFKAVYESEGYSYEYEKDSKYRTMEDCVDKMYME